jgi:orotate phosphoribosyltransferase
MSNVVEGIQAQVAQALLEIDAVIFNPDEPITFKSGIQSPVYIDNRRLPFWPVQWGTVIDAFRQIIAQEKIAFDVIAGIETAGIPHSAALAYAMKIPSVFVRKQVKEHGTQNRVEGGNVLDKRVLLIEDLVTTGSSSLTGIEALRAEGAKVKHCLCITSYGLPEAEQAFKEADVALHPLTAFSTIVLEGSKMGRFGEKELKVLEAWLSNPQGWIEQVQRAEEEAGEEES